jgi:N-acyl-D-aspartate/D-glutamate deacylase
MLTQVPAELFGLKDRGTIAVGNIADLVVFDPETIDSEMLTLVNDLPGGCGRLHAGSTGISHVFVAGEETVTDSRPTGATPGSIIRSGRDTDTVLVD